MKQMSWVELASVACQRFKVEVKQNKRKEKNSFKWDWNIIGYVLNIKVIRSVKHRTTHTYDQSQNQVNIYVFIGSD